MCGITGLANFEGLNPKLKNNLISMTSRLAHRGPDFQAEYMDEFVGLGHRRLSIIDLSFEANQPMETEDKKVAIVFNGEIYNHSEIRKELEGKHAFQTNHSDTEVILNAYREWGIECVSRFTGMFAFALYDREKKVLFLVRDRIGQKPINYFFKGKTLVFSSEIHSLEKSGLIDLKLSDQAIYHYLTFLTAAPGESFYKDVQKVKAGHIVEFSSSGISSRPYWSVTDYLNQESTDSESIAIQRTEELLDKSMVYRNVSDVPVSLALSGGLDSSLNAYYSSKINPDISAINIAFATESEFDESAAAKRYCAELNIPLHTSTLSASTLQNEMLEYLNIQPDVPSGDPNAVLLYFLSKISQKDGRKVLLVGEGGDEIGGYPKYLKHLRRQKLLSTMPGIFKSAFNSRITNLKSADIFFNQHVVSHSNIHGFTESEKRDFWEGAISRSSFELIWNLMDQVKIKSRDAYLRQVLNVEYKLRLPEMILARIDYPSTAASIEARSPFMDHTLIQYSCTLPFGLKMKNDEAKYLLKKIAANKLPSYILQKQKVGFGQLLTPFLNNTLPNWYRSDILEKDAPVKSYINSKFLNEICDRHMKTHKHGYKLWILYALNTWLKKHDMHR